MNILVCLKIVSQLMFADSLGESEDRLSGGKLCINPADLYALELALRIKDKEKGTMVTAVTMAPSFAKDSLLTAIACGADRAVLVSDGRAAGSDTLATAKIITAAIKKLPPQDLILCGKKSIDSETGHVGPQLANMLDLPFIANVLSFSARSGEVDFVCAQDKFTARYSGKLPAVMSVCNGTDMVRVPSITGMRQSKNAEISCFDLDDLAVDVTQVGLKGSPTRTVGTVSVAFRNGNGVIEYDLETGAKKLFELLSEKEADRE